MRAKQMGEVWVALEDGVCCLGVSEEAAVSGVRGSKAATLEAFGKFRGVCVEDAPRVLDGSKWVDAPAASGSEEF